ncbi:MAG TPA: ABC transporter substrate-binding protein [Gaiellaceae bacterium]|nr:ABC transporter substrate-binding protein [Gaiellaceae bacterium]
MTAARRAAIALLFALAALALVTAAGAQDDGEKVVFTVGITNDVDSLNPLVGVEVPDYEVWNIQYATLTDKAAADFATTPGLAESWEASNGGKTYTYTLRDGLEWSDGEPLTAEDVAFTVNRAREEGWLNYDSVVQNLTAKAVDDRTVEITSSVPDPKLPTMDVYILPEHVWGKLDKEAITKYSGEDGVGSGPFTLVELKRGQFWRLQANPGYWGGEPKVDEVVFRLFNNADAMVAALENGEIDAAHDVPTESFAKLESTDGIVALDGQQGGFEEIAVNGGRPENMRVEGIGNGNPALSDLEFRKAIAHAIDKQTLIDRVYSGLGTLGTTMSPSANPAWVPEIPADQELGFDLEKAKQILDAAGYRDTNGDGIREQKGGGDDIVLDYAVRTESQVAAPVAEFVTGWLKEIGIGTRVQPMNDNRLIEVIGKGDYDLFHWGWTPFVDPDPMFSYFQCNQLSSDPDDPTNYYNDASWCDPAYDADYKAQNTELDPDTRMEIGARMLKRMYDAAVYNVILFNGDLQAYRTDRFDGWIRQPAETGPVLFSNTSPTYAALTPIAGSGSGGGGIGSTAIVGIALVGLVVLAAVAWFVMRRRTADERE